MPVRGQSNCWSAKALSVEIRKSPVSKACSALPPGPMSPQQSRLWEAGCSTLYSCYRKRDHPSIGSDGRRQGLGYTSPDLPFASLDRLGRGRDADSLLAQPFLLSTLRLSVVVLRVPIRNDGPNSRSR